MGDKIPGKQKDEQSLVKLYMDLTGRSEADARGVFMHVAPSAEETGESVPAKAE
jgi:hypothetical protein